MRWRGSNARHWHPDAADQPLQHGDLVRSRRRRPPDAQWLFELLEPRRLLCACKRAVVHKIQMWVRARAPDVRNWLRARLV